MAQGSNNQKFGVKEMHAIGSEIIVATDGRLTNDGRISISWVLLTYLNLEDISVIGCYGRILYINRLPLHNFGWTGWRLWYVIYRK